MRSTNSILWTALLLGAAAALTAAAPAAAAGELATMSAFGGGVTWAPQGRYDGGLQLTVGGGDFYLRRHFAAGEVPSFNLVDAAGNLLPDGTYKWELVVTPRARRMSAERYAADRGPGGEAAARQARRPAARVQSGVFTVLNGQVVNPNLEEPARRRASAGEER